MPFCTCLSQNTHEVRDTLSPSQIIDNRVGPLEPGSRLVTPENFRSLVTATGEGDVIKYIQMLPGVSTGAEGSSAIYVRGGNIGSNLVSMDGVPIYGSSHLLGFTSVISPDSISEACYQVGGFSSEQGNLTSSHISLKSITPDFRDKKWSTSASNFLLGGSVSVPLKKDTLAMTTSFRFSPIGTEYSLIYGLLPSETKKLHDVRAVIYDFYSKIQWRVSPQHIIDCSIFHSLDAYKYLYGDYSDEHMRWNNFVLNLHQMIRNKSWVFNNSVSYNNFSSRQGMIKQLDTLYNKLAIYSAVREMTVQTTASRTLGSYFDFQLGLKSRFASFSPGSSSTFSGDLLMQKETGDVGNYSQSSTHTVHAQLSLHNHDTFEFRTGGRLNLYYERHGTLSGWQNSYDPEASILFRWSPVRWIGLEATADWLTQYYHTLEGVPLGWSLDMIVPSDKGCPPESARQYYSGVIFSLKNHRISIGAYDKVMWNLVYYTDATQLFSSALAGWRDNIDIGTGSSRGIEVLYEGGNERINGHIAYTYSKTDRNFQRVNNGEPFPAKFDRTHIFNARFSGILYRNQTGEFGWNIFYTWQSGHWETVAAGYYYGYLLHQEDPIDIDWFTHTNNYRMPPYIRADAGIWLKWEKGHNHHVLNLGIYNVLNRHNPFTVTFDPEERRWITISLFPIMPSMSWRMTL